MTPTAFSASSSYLVQKLPQTLHQPQSENATPATLLPTWANLAPTWLHCEANTPTWVNLAPTWLPCEAKTRCPMALWHCVSWDETHFDHFCLEVLLEPSFTSPQASRETILATFWSQLGPNMLRLGPNFAQLDPNLAPTWPQLGPTWP